MGISPGYDDLHARSLDLSLCTDKPTTHQGHAISGIHRKSLVEFPRLVDLRLTKKGKQK